MLNTKPDPRAFKERAYEAFAQVTKALSSPRRLEMIDLLSQGPCSVDGLARSTGQPIASASQHLQVLHRAHLVEKERHGTTIEYRLAPGTAEVFAQLRRLAQNRSPSLAQTRQDFYTSAQVEETIGRHELQVRLSAGTALLLDVRSYVEYAHGHVEGAHSIPIDELERRVHELPPGKLIVATCRGPFCVYPANAVQLLRDHGREAVRFEDGVAEWSLAGGTVSKGAAP